MLISKSDENNVPAAVDSFTKMASIAIINDEQPDDIMNGLKYIFDTRKTKAII